MSSESRPAALDPHHCRCGRWPATCTARITQEDLLCSNCRAGCSLITLGPEGDAPDLAEGQHVLVSDFRFTLSPAVPS